MSQDGQNYSPLQLRRRIAASPQEIIAAFTEPKQVVEWWSAAAAVHSDLRVSGEYRIDFGGDDYAEGVYHQIQPNRLAFSWITSCSDQEMHETFVTLEVRDQGGVSEVVLSHHLLKSREQHEDHEAGWMHCLDSLEARYRPTPGKQARQVS